jgi:hypothetical protein
VKLKPDHAAQIVVGDDLHPEEREFLLEILYMQEGVLA